MFWLRRRFLNWLNCKDLNMESKLKAALKTTKFKATGVTASGCINNGTAYETDDGWVFVKSNSKRKARLMFDGEFESLKAMRATNTVKVPKPLAVLDDDAGGAVIVMEYLKMSSLHKHSETLGDLLAKMHLHNESLKKKTSTSVTGRSSGNDAEYVANFGFHITTCCGYLPQDNTWKSDWVEFYAQRLESQLHLIESDYGDREALELWSQLKCKIPSYFKDITVTPALLHGDLWSGNAGETDSEPVIFDPASFYGHSEFELAIASMFGGFSRSFYSAYHRILPKQPGFEKRNDLYQLFHYLNHWNHFGGGYKSSSLSIMRRLLKE